MPIIYPARCREATSGKLKQIQRNGYTDDGSLMSVGYLRTLFADHRFISWYFSKIEPAGIFMEALENTKKQIEENAKAIRESAMTLTTSAREANVQMTEVTRKFRDGTEKLGVAMDKLLKIANNGDFAETVRLTGTLVDSLERLAVLEEKGLLDKVMTAMRG